MVSFNDYLSMQIHFESCRCRLRCPHLRSGLMLLVLVGVEPQRSRNFYLLVVQALLLQIENWSSFYHLQSVEVNLVSILLCFLLNSFGSYQGMILLFCVLHFKEPTCLHQVPCLSHLDFCCCCFHDVDYHFVYVIQLFDFHL